MPNRDPEDFRQRSQAGVVDWRPRQCGFCQEHHGWRFFDGFAYRDSSCGCAKGPMENVSWVEVAKKYNNTSDPVLLAQYDQHWGF